MTATAKSKSKTTCRLIPLGDRLVVEREEADSKTAGGILLPDSARDKPSRGRVISIGDGKLLENGKRAPLQVKVGDHVLFTTYGPEEFKVDDQEFLLMRESDVLAIIG
jgi:chaperonin GroES